MSDGDAGKAEVTQAADKQIDKDVESLGFWPAILAATGAIAGFNVASENGLNLLMCLGGGAAGFLLAMFLVAMFRKPLVKIAPWATLALVVYVIVEAIRSQ